MLAASVLFARVPFVADPFLSLSVEAFDSYSIGAFAGSLFGVLVLVAVPVLMLGAVSPWAIRLKMHAVEDSGQMAGRMYAISTVGSLLGTFAASLLLIPLVGTQRTFLIFALITSARGRARAAAALAARAARDRRADLHPGRHGQGRRRRGRDPRGRHRVPVRARGRAARTASATSSSTRAWPCTRSTGPTRCSPATSGTAT